MVAYSHVHASLGAQLRAGLAPDEFAEVVQSRLVEGEERIARLHLRRTADPFDAVALGDELGQSWHGFSVHGRIVRQF